MINKFSLKSIVLNAVYTALYVVLCIVFQPISYGLVQIRIAEALCIMPIFDNVAIISISLGCLISNIYNANFIDAIFGTLATFLGLLCIKFIKTNNFFIKMLPTIISNTIIIPLVLKYGYGLTETPLIISAAYVAIGEIVAVYVLGYLLYNALNKIYPKLNNGNN